ncbi:MAG: hypothetical protein C0402_07145 [Thermodesulfovibrio sp.]|nr:hypothetical protein [Thermodesulfovibrio sp.]
MLRGFFKSIFTSLVSCALIAGCTTSKNQGANVLTAYEAAMSNKTEEARKLMKSGHFDSFGSFLLSCLELSDGNMVLARHYADEFIASNPSVPDGKVLVELIEERKAYPDDPWLTSFVDAWKAAGSPELGYIFNLFERPTLAEGNETCKEWNIPEAFVGKPDALIAALDLGIACNTENFVELCLSQTTPETPIAIKLLALTVIDSTLSQSSCNDSGISNEASKRITERRHQVMVELTIQSPEDMAFPLIAILDQVKDKNELSLPDIKLIEEAVARPRLSPSAEQLYKDYLPRYIAVGSKTPYLSASSEAFSVISSLFIYELREKMEETAKTASPELKGRIAAILERIGKAEIKNRTMIGAMLGFNWLRSAALIRDDKVAESHLSSLYTYLMKVFSLPIIYAAGSSSLWPIPSLMVDSTDRRIKDEMAVYQIFADIDIEADLLHLLNPE